MASRKINTSLSVLAFRRALSPTHFGLFGSQGFNVDPASHRPLVVREEPLRGLNATHKTDEAKKGQAVLQVVESAELGPKEDTLVLKGNVAITGSLANIESCNNSEFQEKHTNIIKVGIAEGDIKELARRYAFQIASGAWGWRNADQASDVLIVVSHGGVEWRFQNLMFDAKKGFNFSEYPEHTSNLSAFAEVVEKGFIADNNVRATLISITGYFLVGHAARVYPSQEWPSDHAKAESKRKWQGGEGITRVLAKLNVNGVGHAIINDRKVGNSLRTIDTWYSDDKVVLPIAVEPYGGSSHKDQVMRSKSELNVFGISQRILAGTALTQKQRLYYIASIIRGGVYGSNE